MLSKKRFGTTLALGVAGVLLAGHAGAADAQYPDHAIKMVVPFVAGGATDAIARVIAQGMSQRLGQPIVVENKGGANGIIATSSVTSSKPDGYTLLLCTSALAINASLYKTPYDVLTDLTPISVLASVPLLLVTKPDLPVQSAQDLVTYAKQHPLSYSSYGIGSSAHLAGELFRQSTGSDMVHVPFKGSSPALNEVLAGRIPFTFTTIPLSLQFIRIGKLRVLGTTASSPVPGLEDVPILKDSGLPDVVVEGWNGVCAPSGVDADIREKIYKSIIDTLKEPKVRQRLTDEGYVVVGNSPEEFARSLKAEVPRYAEVIKKAGITAE